MAISPNSWKPTSFPEPSNKRTSLSSTGKPTGTSGPAIPLLESTRYRHISPASVLDSPLINRHSEGKCSLYNSMSLLKDASLDNLRSRTSENTRSEEHTSEL